MSDSPDTFGPAADYLGCSAAAKLAPGRPSAATVWRWATAGIKTPAGRIRLRSIRMGGKIFTTAEWLVAFGAACAAAHETEPVPAPPVQRGVSSLRRQQQIEEARRELANA